MLGWERRSTIWIAGDYHGGLEGGKIEPADAREHLGGA